MSLIGFNVQFAAASPDLERAYTKALQTMTKAPWMAFPPQVLHNMGALGMPGVRRHSEHISLVAEVSVLRCGAVWHGV